MAVCKSLGEGGGGGKGVEIRLHDRPIFAELVHTEINLVIYSSVCIIEEKEI